MRVATAVRSGHRPALVALLVTAFTASGAAPASGCVFVEHPTASHHTTCRETSFAYRTLQGHNFGWADFAKSDFLHANVAHSNFNDAHLSDVRFLHAEMFGARLNHAHAQRANFSHAAIQHGQFSHADLSHARFVAAGLKYADLTYANLTGATFLASGFGDVHLRGAHFCHTIMPDGSENNADC